MPLRPIPLKSIPTNLVRPLQGTPLTNKLYARKPDPAQVLLAMGSELPPNIRVQAWASDDKQRWRGMSKAVRDGVYDKKTKKWVQKGLKTMLRDF